MVLSGNQTFDFFDYRYDGTNVLSYAVTKQGGPDTGSGLIENGEVPRSWTSAAGEYVWLAFASACYFNTRQGLGSVVALQELRSPHGATRRFEVPARWTSAPNSPHLPLTISFLKTNQILLEDSGVVTSLPLTPPFDSGYIYAKYRALEFTNFNDLEIPLEFEYSMYRPQQRAWNTNELIATLIVHGKVNFVGSYVPPPPVPGMLNLADERVPEPIVRYRVRKGIIPDTNSTNVMLAQKEAIQTFNNALRMEPRGLRKENRSAVWTIVLGAIFMSLLVYVAVRRLWDKKRNQPTINPRKVLWQGRFAN